MTFSMSPILQVLDVEIDDQQRLVVDDRVGPSLDSARFIRSN
jgi:hypothetical protein